MGSHRLDGGDLLDVVSDPLHRSLHSRLLRLLLPNLDDGTLHERSISSLLLLVHSLSLTLGQRLRHRFLVLQLSDGLCLSLLLHLLRIQLRLELVHRRPLVLKSRVQHAGAVLLPDDADTTALRDCHLQSLRKGREIVSDELVLGSHCGRLLHYDLIRRSVVSVDGEGGRGGGELDEQRAHVGKTTGAGREDGGDHVLDVADQIGVRLREMTGSNGNSNLVGSEVEHGVCRGFLERLSHRISVVEHVRHLVCLDELLSEVLLHRFVHALLNQENVVGRRQLALVSECVVHSDQLSHRHNFGDVCPRQSVIRLNPLLPLARLLLNIRVRPGLVRDVQIGHDHAEDGRSSGDRGMGQSDVLLEGGSVDHSRLLVRHHHTQSVVGLGEQRLLPLFVHVLDQGRDRDTGLLIDLGQCLLGRCLGRARLLLHLLLLWLFHLLLLRSSLLLLLFLGDLDQRALLHRLLLDGLSGYFLDNLGLLGDRLGSLHLSLRNHL
ncbi:hypothetical protein PFISCL1PPCAC_549, partial [Pristionchus fissidentatus]